jgi:uncharacterized protein YggE
MKKLLISIMLIAVIALSGCVISPMPGNENTINVDGSSELTFDPDEAEVWAGYTVVKQTAQEAQSEATSVINKIIDGLRYKGISESDMSTEQLSLYEEQRWEDGESKVVGWRATQVLKIKTKELSKVGTIVDVAASNGANQIQNINFGLSNEKETEYKKQALAQATTAAREKAETIAESLGVKLGKIKTVSESNYYYSPRAYMMEKSVGMDAVAEASQVLPGKVTVSAQISLVYEVK